MARPKRPAAHWRRKSDNIDAVRSAGSSELRKPRRPPPSMRRCGSPMSAMVTLQPAVKPTGSAGLPVAEASSEPRTVAGAPMRSRSAGILPTGEPDELAAQQHEEAQHRGGGYRPGSRRPAGRGRHHDVDSPGYPHRGTDRDQGVATYLNASQPHLYRVAAIRYRRRLATSRSSMSSCTDDIAGQPRPSSVAKPSGTGVPTTVRVGSTGAEPIRHHAPRRYSPRPRRVLPVGRPNSRSRPVSAHVFPSSL